MRTLAASVVITSVVLAGAGLPDPQTLIVLLSAAGLGLGIGCGGGYAVFRQRRTKADIRAYRAWDEAKRASTLVKLEQAADRLARREAQLDELTRKVDTLEQALEGERGTTERLRVDLVDFAVHVLRDRHLLASEEPQAPKEPDRESHPPPGPDR